MAASRYFIKDVKRARKLACCSSISSEISKIETKFVDSTDLDDNFHIPDEKSYSFDSNLSSDSKWWIQLQPDFMHQRGLTLTSEKVKVNKFDENQDSLSSRQSFEFVDILEAEKDDLKKVKAGQSMCKMKILEALCHSQTRARKAEIAAKKACAEKEHVVKILFKQASQLFAYKQWVYVMQLENLCYQIKDKKGDPMLSVYGSKIGELDDSSKKLAPSKRKRPRARRRFGLYKHDLGKYAVVFVVGLGIVGAGLVFGWTVGWMLI